jgi:multiple sugar transport system ATP-binding protein
MGAEIYLYLNVVKKDIDPTAKGFQDDPQRLIARVSSRSTSRAGDSIQVALDASRIHIFDKDTERCIVH